MSRYDDRMNEVERSVGIPPRLMARHVLRWLQDRTMPLLRGENRTAFLFACWLCAIGGGARASTEAEVEAAMDRGRECFFLGPDPVLGEDVVALIRELEGLGLRQPNAESQGEWA